MSTATNAYHPSDHFAETVAAPSVGDVVGVLKYEEWDLDGLYPERRRAEVVAVAFRESPYGSPTYRVGVSPRVTVRHADGTVGTVDHWEDWHEGVRVVEVGSIRRRTLKRWDDYAKQETREVHAWRVVTFEDSVGRTIRAETTADDRNGAAALAEIVRLYPEVTR